MGTKLELVKPENYTLTIIERTGLIIQLKYLQEIMTVATVQN